MEKIIIKIQKKKQCLKSRVCANADKRKMINLWSNVVLTNIVVVWQHTTVECRKSNGVSEIGVALWNSLMRQCANKEM